MTVLGKVLALLNVLAAAAFGYLVVLDHTKRESFTAAVREHDLAKDGLPAQEQYNDPSGPRERYLADQPDRPDSESLKARFQAAGAPGQPVAVQTEEVKRIRKEVIAAVNSAADEFVKDAKDKEKALREVLLPPDPDLPLPTIVAPPLALTGTRLGEYEKRIAAAKTEKDRDALLLEAAKRSMYAQLLLPLEELRPHGRRDLLAAAIGDLSKPLSDLEKLVESRFDEALDPVSHAAADAEAKKNNKDKAEPAKLETQGEIFDLVNVKAAPFRVRYDRFPKDQKITVALIDQTGKPTSVPGPVRVKITNVESRPSIDLTSEGGAFTGKHEVFGTDQVLAGEIALTVSGKEERCLFIEREPLDRRQAIAYLLVTLSQVNRPDGKALLDSLPEKRVEVIVGRQRFNRVLEMQALLLRQIAARRFPTIEADRLAFIDSYRLMLIQRLPYLMAAIKRHQAIKKYWDDQLSEHEDQKRARRLFRDQILDKVQAERKKANDALAKLTEAQEMMFRAQAAGAGVAEENQRLEKLIRFLETGR